MPKDKPSYKKLQEGGITKHKNGGSMEGGGGHSPGIFQIIYIFPLMLHRLKMQEKANTRSDYHKSETKEKRNKTKAWAKRDDKCKDEQGQYQGAV